MTTPDNDDRGLYPQRGYAPENEGRPEPTLVQYKDQDFEAAVARDDAAGVTSSANRKYWARAIDDQYVESVRASNAAQVAAFAEYQRRPDIESRASILAREQAAPAAFENVVVPNGKFEDAVANDEDNDRPGYIGQFDFEDYHGLEAASSNGGGRYDEREARLLPFTEASYDNPGTETAGSATNAPASEGGPVDPAGS